MINDGPQEQSCAHVSCDSRATCTCKCHFWTDDEVAPNPTEPALPTFTANPDGVHFQFSHDCTYGSGRTFRDQTLMPHGGGTWRITSAPGAPLTVTPSINCTACGTHGWITDGKWWVCDGRLQFAAGPQGTVRARSAEL